MANGNGARTARIRNLSRKARANFRRNVNNVANAQYGTNNTFNAQMAAIYGQMNNDGALNEGLYNQLGMIEQQRALKQSFKTSAVEQIKQALQGSAAERFPSLYQEAKTVLNSELPRFQPLVKKIVALDDLIALKKMELATATTNEGAEEAAAIIVDAENLKEELDFARHTNRVATVEQEARYEALITGIDFTTMNSSVYGRLLQNNAAKNAAARTIQRVERGRQGRQTARRARIMRNLNRLAAAQAAQGAPLQMVDPAALAAEAPAAAAPLTAAERAQRRALMLARFNKPKGGRTTRRRKN